MFLLSPQQEKKTDHWLCSIPESQNNLSSHMYVHSLEDDVVNISFIHSFIFIHLCRVMAIKCQAREAPIHCVRFSPHTEGVLGFGCDDATASVLNVNTQAVLYVPIHLPVRTRTHTQREKFIFLVSVLTFLNNSKIVCVFRHSFVGHKDFVRAFEWDVQNDHDFVTGGWDRTVYFHSLQKK